MDQMLKCDMCYDRTSVGLKPMCATVCPSGALYYGPRKVIEKQRREKAINAIEDGRAAAGPPKRPLPRIVLALRGEEIWATGVEL